tara:strand:- start:915 stop:1031 length:117 start_codon:yes stop_codon:yes gene_type:complete
MNPIDNGKFTHVFKKGNISAPEPGAVITNTSFVSLKME